MKRKMLMRKILYFYARECPPCKFYKKQFIEPLEKIVGKEKIQHMNARDYPLIAEQYCVERLPALLLLEDGKVVFHCLGAVNIDELADYLQKVENKCKEERRGIPYV